MNENHSHGEGNSTKGARTLLETGERPGLLAYRPRWIGDRLRASLDVAPVTVITGARQTGKSTLLAHEEPFCHWRRVTLDDFDALGQAHSEPEALWAGASEIVIDEAQRAPGLLSAIKRQVDRDRFGVRFALSGSANLLLMNQVSESLAGRATYHTLGPFALGEISRQPVPGLLGELLEGKLPQDGSSHAMDPYPHIARGLLPGVIGLGGGEATQWWEGYTITYLERDLRQLSQIESLPDYRRFMESVALRSGSLLNQTDVSREIGVSQATVHRYANLLETSHLLTRVHGYSGSRTQRLAKRPKAYLFDAGAASYLAGIYDEETLRDSRERGGLFEGLVLQHLLALAAVMTPTARIHYWRTASGTEVDFVIEHGRRLLPVEVKLTSNPGYRDISGLSAFLSTQPQAACGVLVHTGTDIRRLAERIVAVPWTFLTGIS